MAAKLAQEGKQLARKVLFYQSIVAMFCTLFFTFYSGINSGISALYGGLICLVPGIVFAFFAFRYAGARQNDLVVRSFNKGNKLKFIFTILLFAWVFKSGNAHPMPLLVSYVVTLMAQWPIIILISRVNR